ncbi:MAG: hypothetical protein V4732_20870 [Pseudomonadota bacterium]
MNIEELNKEAKSLAQEIWKDSSKWNVNIEKAKELTRLALSENPKHEISLIIMGTLLCDCGQHAKAAEYFKLAITNGSEDRNAYFNLGVALINCAAHEEAMEYMKIAKAKQSNPATWEAYFDPMGH